VIIIVLTSKKGVFMKNTKNVLVTGVALAIALFMSVQVIAMKQDFTVSKFAEIYRNSMENPYLTLDQRIGLRERMREVKLAIAMSNSLSQVKKFEKDLEDLKKIYYGNRPYTDAELR
jgi:hypothetical protein